MLGIISIAVGVGLHEYYMRTQRLHIEGLTEQGVFVGLALILVGVIYAVTPSPFTKTFMVVLMILANVGFIAALWVLSTESPRHPAYWQYLYYVKWVFLPPWLIINAAGTYFLFKTRKKEEKINALPSLRAPSPNSSLARNSSPKNLQKTI